MNWVIIIWAMVASSCLTLAMMHLLVWCNKRTAWASLLFSLSALATVGLAVCEVLALRAETVNEFGTVLRWGHVPFWVLLLSLVGFVRLYMRAGRLWLAWTICGLRTLSLILNFVFTPNINFREITGLRQFQLFGETVSVAVGIPNPWMLIGQSSLVLFLFFLVDATWTMWRRGERLSMLLLSSTMAFFITVSLGQFVFGFWGINPIPLTPSMFFLGVVSVMAWEMSRAIIQTAQLSDDLCKKEEWLDLAADSAGVGLWLWDFKTNVIWATERARLIYGFSPDEQISFDTFLSRLHPNDFEWVAQASQKCRQEGADFRYDYRIVLPDDSIRWVKVLAKTLFVPNGTSNRMTGVSIDITEHKLAELALQMERSFSETLLESLPGLFYLYTFPEMRLVRWNRNHETATGYGPGELRNRHALDWYAPADQEAVTEGIKKVIELGSFMIESNLIMKDGRSMPYLLTGARFQYLDQLYCMGIGMDITERKQMELELQQKRNELAHINRVSTMGQLASTLAHELSQPLGAILRNAEAMGLMLEDPSPDLAELRDITEDICKDDQRAGQVIDRMRAMMKKRESKQYHLDLTLLLGEVITLVQSDADRRHVGLVLDINPALPSIHGDPVQLQQVFINLLLNAFDALEENQPELPLVKVSARPVGKTVKVAVSDNGGGIAEDDTLHLFEPFFSTKPHGLGMGLAISRGIIETHEGRLWVETNVTGGQPSPSPCR
ncbi:PAS domain S-box protein [uncultured Desulfobulbus sp.]|uniref:PAS domain S-box protein n=1 Tax=uncultured Desulfobulbus sp. TaxID=239745 RepID=UPI0029C7577D|nr:PAS domain S-box protein [uncultured Desulfobulbus sp.]